MASSSLHVSEKLFFKIVFNPFIINITVLINDYGYYFSEYGTLSVVSPLEPINY